MVMFRRVGDEADALANLAYVHAQRGEHQQAMQLYSQALSHNGDLRPAAEAMLALDKHRKQHPVRRLPTAPHGDFVSEVR